MRKAYCTATLLLSLVLCTKEAVAETRTDQNRPQAHDHVGDHSAWCTLHVVQRRYHEAIEDCDKALAATPDVETLYANRSAAHFMIGEIDQAIADVEAALRLNTSNAVSHYNRGLLYAHKGELSIAIAAYTEAILLNPSRAHAYHNRGVLLERMGERDKAIDDYRTALRLAPNSSLTRQNLKRLGVE